jgi:ribonuclease P protein component
LSPPRPLGPAAGEGFSRGDRLRKRREFEECYASGTRVSGRHLQIFSLPESGPSRLGISVPRRVGSATLRNRVRRRLREIFRRNRALLGPSGLRLVIHARPSAAQASFAELLEDYRSALSRAATPKTTRR